MARVAYVDGQYSDLPGAVVSVEDRGLQFADSVYEVIALVAGRLVDLDQHLARLARSRSGLGLPTPMAGITLAALVLVIGREPNLGQIMLVMAFATAIAAAMISDFRYYSFKDIDVRARVNTPATLLLSLGIFALGVLILLEFGATAVLLVCLAYLLSGFVISSRYFLRKLRGGRKKLLAWLKKSKLADFFGKSDS